MANVEVLVDVGPDDGTLGWREMLAHAGITYRQLDYWTHTGVLRTVRPAAGSGTKRHWSAEQAVIARALGRLSRASGSWSATSLVRIAANAIRRGEHVFEIIPGVQVDLDRLVADDPAEPCPT